MVIVKLLHVRLSFFRRVVHRRVDVHIRLEYSSNPIRP